MRHAVEIRSRALSREREASRYTTFKRAERLSYEDKDFLERLGQRLRRMDVAGAPRAALWWAHSEGWRFSPLSPWQRWVDRNFDRRYGVDTRTRAQITDLTVVGDNAEHGVYYQASPVIDTRRAIAALPITPADWTFIDVGSGKGRVLLLASEQPFERVVGLEFAKEVHEIATLNIARYQKRRSKSVESVLGDATHFEFPDANLVVYFFNPFSAHIVRLVLANLHRSIDTSGRIAYIIYHHPGAPEIFADGTRYRLLGRRRKFWTLAVLPRGAHSSNPANQ